VFAGSREDELTLKIRGVPYLEILRRGGGILKTLRLTREAKLDDLVRQARERLDIALLHGTTTMEAKSGYGLDMKNEIKILRACKKLNEEHPMDIIPTFMGAHAIPPEFKDNPNGYVDIVIDMLPRIVREGLAVFNDVFVEKGVFDRKQGRRILLEGKKYGLIPKVHADEFHDMGGASLAAEVGAISADHLLWSAEEGLKMMAKRGTVGVLLPAASVALMGSKFADAETLKRLGVPIALGTDLNPNCWIENMQLVMTLAVYFLRLTPAEAISAATINAAHAVGLAEIVGSIEKGKLADLIILRVPSHLWIGYRFGANLVEYVIKSGRVVVEDGRLVYGEGC